MRIVVQRVSSARVEVDGTVCGEIGKGMLVFLGIHKDDTAAATEFLSQKLVNLRIFEDAAGKMNLALKEVGGEVLVVSQFTLYGSCLSGRRPDFIDAMRGPEAEALYEKFVAEIKAALGRVQTGKFGADMKVHLVNDGPVTFVVDSL